MCSMGVWNDRAVADAAEKFIRQTSPWTPVARCRIAKAIGVSPKRLRRVLTSDKRFDYTRNKKGFVRWHLSCWLPLNQ